MWFSLTFLIYEWHPQDEIFWPDAQSERIMQNQTSWLRLAPNSMRHNHCFDVHGNTAFWRHKGTFHRRSCMPWQIYQRRNGRKARFIVATQFRKHQSVLPLSQLVDGKFHIVRTLEQRLPVTSIFMAPILLLKMLTNSSLFPSSFLKMLNFFSDALTNSSTVSVNLEHPTGSEPLKAPPLLTLSLAAVDDSAICCLTLRRIPFNLCFDQYLQDRKSRSFSASIETRSRRVR